MVNNHFPVRTALHPTAYSDTLKILMKAGRFPNSVIPAQAGIQEGLRYKGKCHGDTNVTGFRPSPERQRRHDLPVQTGHD